MRLILSLLVALVLVPCAVAQSGSKARAALAAVQNHPNGSMSVSNSRAMAALALSQALSVRPEEPSPQKKPLPAIKPQQGKPRVYHQGHYWSWDMDQGMYVPEGEGWKQNSDGTWWRYRPAQQASQVPILQQQFGGMNVGGCANGSCGSGGGFGRRR